ncbi:MAG: calcium-translocating P-type ATPase, PMCA-type [Christensenellaceae bacterium]|jgi:calcium-translocating P-type ATPase|nr:calcium-translocating P-type ATPase, PMCA-type [Christensenellaceae bacterium]
MKKTGLSDAEVILSREKFGTNAVQAKNRRTAFQVFLANFGDPMLKILLIALGINVVFLIFNGGEILETVGIAAAVVVAVLVSTLSEMGSENAFKKLQEATALCEVRVRRNGEVCVLPMTEVVVGDVVLLGAGDKIPADGDLIEGKLYVDQSVLNGESKEAYRSLDGDITLLGGAVITSGTGEMRITKVGAETVYGKIAAELTESAPTSPLKVKLEKLAKLISLIGYIGAGLVFITYMFAVLVLNNGIAQIGDWSFVVHHFLQAATLIVAVIVMAVPEGLPMMITVVLSSNMKSMMKDNLLVRKLSAVETAGSLNILLTDKTGTLTKGKLEVASFIGAKGFADEPRGEQAKALATALIYNNGAEFVGGRAIGGNITDRVLCEYANKTKIDGNLRKIDTIPFESSSKFMATTVETADGARTFFKGAQEILLERCANFINENGEVKKIGDRTALLNAIDDATKKAMRVICVAVGFDPIIGGQVRMNDLTLIGLLCIRDELRDEARLSVMALHNAKVQVVMITGDAKPTATAIATEVGILSGDSDEVVLTSDEMNNLKDEELARILPKLRVVARALPSDKSRLVRIAQSQNLVVGMTGDGVNDAPALKKAELGFAMGSGTEVAKEAGDIVIVDDNISSIVKAVSYGRTIFKSIRRFLVFKLAINFCAMAVCIVAPLFNIATPITVIQMLWINLVMDTLAGLAFGGEKPQKEYLTEPPKRRDENIVTKSMWNQILISSIVMSGLSIWFLLSPFIQSHFEGAWSSFYAGTAFFAFFMFMNIFNAFNSRTERINIFKGLSGNKMFMIIMGIVFVAQIGIVYLGGTVFHTSALSINHFLLTIVLALIVFPIETLRKTLYKTKV